MTVADDRRYGGDHVLWDGEELDDDKRMFSCDAVGDVCGWEDVKRVHVVNFLYCLGCKVNRLNEFDEFRFGPDRQGARFL